MRPLGGVVMRLMVFMSRMLAMVVTMVGVLLIVFVLLALHKATFVYE